MTPSLKVNRISYLFPTIILRSSSFTKTIFRKFYMHLSCSHNNPMHTSFFLKLVTLPIPPFRNPISIPSSSTSPPTSASPSSLPPAFPTPHLLSYHRCKFSTSILDDPHTESDLAPVVDLSSPSPIISLWKGIHSTFNPNPSYVGLRYHRLSSLCLSHFRLLLEFLSLQVKPSLIQAKDKLCLMDIYFIL